MEREELNELIVKDSDFDLGDTVVSRKTGLPSMGEVVGVVTGPLFVEMHQGRIVWRQEDDDLEEDSLDTLMFVVTHQRDNNMMMYKRWSDLYPRWMWSPIAYVRFEKPQKNMSLDEFKESFSEDDMPSTETIKEIYKRDVPTSNIVAYPVEDLEKLDS